MFGLKIFQQGQRQHSQYQNGLSHQITMAKVKIVEFKMVNINKVMVAVINVEVIMVENTMVEVIKDESSWSRCKDVVIMVKVITGMVTVVNITKQAPPKNCDRCHNFFCDPAPARCLEKS